MEEHDSVSQWLEKRCQLEHLSHRQAGIKTGLSHATIADIRKGEHPSPESIRKLSRAFGGDGKQGLVLEDQLLTLAGYRTPRLEGEEISEALAQLLDKVSNFNEAQLTIMVKFADFVTGLGKLK